MKTWILIIMKVYCKQSKKNQHNTSVEDQYYYSSSISEPYYYYTYVENKQLILNQINDVINYITTNKQKFPLLTQIENLKFEMYKMKNTSPYTPSNLPGYSYVYIAFYTHLWIAIKNFQYS